MPKPTIRDPAVQGGISLKEIEAAVTALIATRRDGAAKASSGTRLRTRRKAARKRARRA